MSGGERHDGDAMRSSETEGRRARVPAASKTGTSGVFVAAPVADQTPSAESPAPIVAEERDSFEHLVLQHRGERSSDELVEWVGHDGFRLSADANELPFGDGISAPPARVDALRDDEARVAFVTHAVVEGCVRGTLVALQFSLRAEDAQGDLRDTCLDLANRESESALVAWRWAAEAMDGLAPTERARVSVHAFEAITRIGEQRAPEDDNREAWLRGVDALSQNLEARLGLSKSA